MTLTLAVTPQFVPAGYPSTVAIKVDNDGDAMELGGFQFTVDVQLVDPASAALANVPRGWTALPPVVVDRQARFRVNAPAGYLLLSEVAFDLPTSASAATGNIAAGSFVSGGNGPVEFGSVTVSVTSDVAFTSLNLNPVQVGPNQPTTLSWDSVGAASCSIAWTPAEALTVTVGGHSSQPGDSTMSVPVAAQATLVATQTAHLTVTAVAADDTQRDEQVSLWMPDLALEIIPQWTVLDPETLDAISYSAVNDPNSPTTITLAWSGNGADVLQGDLPVPNRGEIDSPKGWLNVAINSTTEFTFVATTTQGLQSAAIVTLFPGAMASVSLRHTGGYIAAMLVKATAQGRDYELTTGLFTRSHTRTVLVPVDAAGVGITIGGATFFLKWKVIATYSFAPMRPGGLSFHSYGSVDDMHATYEG